MPIEWADRSKNKGFTMWPDAFYTPSIGMDSDCLSECVSEAKRRQLKGVFGTVPFFREDRLDFLLGLPELEAAAFWDVALRDISALYQLRELRYLRLGDKRPALDFTKLMSLRALVWNHRAQDRGSGFLHELKELYLWRYKPVEATFESLELPQSLSSLSILWSSAKSLDGLPSLPHLSRLVIERCRNLESLGQLAASCPNVETLVISASGRLSAKEAMRVASCLPRLQHLFAANKLLVGSNAA